MQQPYVVSADVRLLMSRWAEQKKFVLPNESFFTEMRSDFSEMMSSIFSGFKLISENELVVGTQKFIEKQSVPIISLDRVYSSSNLMLDITRCVDSKKNDRGMSSRFGSEPIDQQIKQIKDRGISEVVLVDDVIFTGSLIVKLIELLSVFQIHTSCVYAGIGIEQGMQKIKKNVSVDCLFCYKTVIDQVCERDFYAGVPFSGRSLLNSKNVGMPYFYPFGNPEKWASIPKKYTKEFSQFCMNQTIKLFEAVEKKSNRVVLCDDLDRKAIPCSEGERFVNILKRFL